MKKLKLSEAQITTMLSEAAAGIPVVELCRKYNVANSTFYKLKSKYAGMTTTELKRPLQLSGSHAGIFAFQLIECAISNIIFAT